MTLHAPSPSAAPFVGRNRELSQIAQLLSNPDCRLLTLVGPGGIGKTRLALEATAIAKDNFPDGASVIYLAPVLSPDFLVPTICQALTITLYGEQYMKAQLLNYLSLKHLLLVLDNYEHLLEGAGVLAEILENVPHAKILVTSRERLNLREEWVLEVQGLPFPANESETDIERYSAVELFLHNARRVSVGFDVTDTHKPAIVRICRLVGGMPLALELAAAWVRVLPCEAIADEIERSLDILETPARNIEPRHHNMRAAIEPTWEQLNSAEQVVFKKLSVFRGGFTREAAAYITGASLRILSALVDKSLLRLDDRGRYTIHELLRQYGQEHLTLSTDDANQTHDLHCEYYTTFMQQQWEHLAGSRVKESLQQIEQEIDNVRAAWQWAITWKKASEIDKALDSLWLYSDIRGYYQEGEQAFANAAAMLGEQGDAWGAVLARALVRQAWACTGIYHWEKALTLLEESLVVASGVNARRETALAHLLLGTVVSVEDIQSVQSRQHYQESLEIFEEIGDQRGVADATVWLCFAYERLGELQESLQHGQKALAMFRAMDNRVGLALAQLAIGLTAISAEDYREAMLYAHSSSTIAEEIGIRSIQAHALRTCAAAAFELKQYQEAQRWAFQALKIASEFQGTYFMRWTLPVVAGLLELQGQRVRALEIMSLVIQPGSKNYGFNYLRTYKALEAALPPDVFAAAVERGKALDLDMVVKELLGEWSPHPETPAASTAPSDLTERELEILQLIADGLSNREIAEQLVLAVSSVKWYTNQIFSKLHVGSRTQAVAQARTLGLLP